MVLSLNLTGSPAKPLALFGSLGLLESEYDIPLSVDLDSREQAHAPAYQFALGARAQITDSLAVSIDIEGKDEFYLSSSHSEQSESYELINASLEYNLGDWELSLWGRNLTDKDAYCAWFWWLSVMIRARAGPPNLTTSLAHLALLASAANTISNQQGAAIWK